MPTILKPVGRKMVAIGIALLLATGLAWISTGLSHTTARAADSATTTSPTLARNLAEARVATAKYATSLEAAQADGYQIITKMIPDMGYHYLNPNISGFDIHKPPILVYEHKGNSWQLGALEWVFTSMPQTPPLPNATIGFFPAACHYVDGTFVLADAQNQCPTTAPDSHAAFNFWHPPLFTMHVWVWYPNPAGLYASTNPMLTPFNNG